MSDKKSYYIVDSFDISGVGLFAAKTTSSHIPAGHVNELLKKGLISESAPENPKGGGKNNKAGKPTENK